MKTRVLMAVAALGLVAAGFGMGRMTSSITVGATVDSVTTVPGTGLVTTFSTHGGGKPSVSGTLVQTALASPLFAVGDGVDVTIAK